MNIIGKKIKIVIPTKHSKEAKEFEQFFIIQIGQL